MEVAQERLPTLAALAENTVFIVRIGQEDWTPDTSVFIDDLEKWVAKTFQTVRLSDLSPFELSHSPLVSIGDWSTGNIRYNFVTGQDEDQSKWSLLYPNKKVSLVIGLLHCPSVNNLKKAFEGFRDDVFKQFPFLEDSAVRCCALDISDDQQQRFDISGMIKKGLEVFPPSNPSKMIEATNETAIQFHMHFVINTATSHLMRHIEGVLKECDAMGDAMKRVLLKRTSSGLMSSGPTASPGPNLPPIHDAETCRLFAGAPSFPGDASHSLAVSLSSQASRKSFKALQARLQVWTGKQCLLSGSPLDALARLAQGAVACKAAEDYIWEAICWEAIACAREIAQIDGWALPAAEEVSASFSPTLASLSLSPGPASTPAASSVADALESSIALLQRGLTNHSVKRLLAETCIRSANARLASNPSVDGVDQALEVLTVARRAHAEHNTFAWYITLEARLWNFHKQSKLVLLCVTEAFSRFVAQDEVERAFRVVEEDFVSAFDGFVPFVSLKRSKDPVSLCLPYSYGLWLLLKRILDVLRANPHMQDRFLFYGFHFLGVILSKPNHTAKDKDDILRLTNEMAAITSSNLVIPSGAAATFPIVDGVTPLSTEPTPYFDITGDGKPPPSLAKRKQKDEDSVFLYSPFKPSKATSTDHNKENQQEETFWVAGEDCFVNVQLRNPFSIPVSCSIGIPSTEPKKVVIPGRDSVVIKLGPVPFDPEQETLVLELTSLGTKFLVKIPMPTVAHAMPLLVREDGGKSLRNIGTVTAHVLNPSNPRQVICEIPPKGKHESISLDNLRYCNRAEKPRLVRELLPSVPSLSSIKIHRCDTMDHLQFEATASACLSLEVSDKSCIGKELKVVSKFDGQVLTQQPLSAVRTDVKVAIPPKSIASKEYSEDDADEAMFNDFFQSLNLELDGHDGFLLEKNNGAMKIAVASTAPPSWCFFNVDMKVDAPKVKVLEFTDIQTSWQMPPEAASSGIQFELRAFRRSVRPEGPRFEPCEAEDIVWAGCSSWACTTEVDAQGVNNASFAFLHANEYILAWSATSRLKVRWWLKCTRVRAEL